MWQFIRQNVSEIGAAFTALAFILSVMVIAFSSFRYVSLRRDEAKHRRYEQYHSLLLKVSRGTDNEGQLKLVSQRAFIYELRHFPEYRALTTRLLQSLLTDWKEDSDKNAKLTFEIEETIRSLK